MADNSPIKSQITSRFIRLPGRDGTSVTVLIVDDESINMMQAALKIARAAHGTGGRLHSDWHCLGWAMEDTITQLNRLAQVLSDGTASEAHAAFLHYYKHSDVLCKTWERIVERLNYEATKLPD